MLMIVGLYVVNKLRYNFRLLYNHVGQIITLYSTFEQCVGRVCICRYIKLGKKHPTAVCYLLTQEYACILFLPQRGTELVSTITHRSHTKHHITLLVKSAPKYRIQYILNTTHRMTSYSMCIIHLYQYKVTLTLIQKISNARPVFSAILFFPLKRNLLQQTFDYFVLYYVSE